MLRRLAVVVPIVAVSLISFTPVSAQQAKGQRELSPQEKRQQRIMERFVSLLERRPRKGTALDRIYGYHVERGTLRKLVEKYQKQTQADGKDGGAWMVLGLIEAQRGRDAEAVKAFRQAEKHRPRDAMASYYLGQSLVLVGQPEKAAEAFERAISRKPRRPDLLEIFQALGRIHQRSQRNSAALKVWDRLEKLFPDAERVQESIATILADEGQHENAMKRFSSLSKKARDRYRQVQYGVRAASLKVKLGRTKDALVDFEKILNQLNPRSWLHREVRQEIESVFLRTDDYAGLTRYYEKWLKTHKEDVGAMTRLARTLSVQGRNKEAERWYKQSLKLAPSNKQLRSFLIDQLIRSGRVKDAIAQYEELNKVDPNNPDYLRDWGNLLLNDKSKSLAERKKAAADIWRKLLEDKTDDAVVTAQVADLFRHANMQKAAIELYQKAIQLAPESPQYREYLGEYYHKLGNSQDALATWQAMADGKNKTARNLARLAEVLNGFGYQKQALTTMGDAVKLDGKSFNFRVAYAGLLHADSQYDLALAELDQAAALAESTEERQTVLKEQIRIFQASKKLAQQIAALSAELQAGRNATAARWHRLALYYHAASKPADATRAIQRSLQLDERSITTWSTAAGIFEHAGRLGDAVNAYRKLSVIDRRYRTEHLTQVANLEMRLGRQDDAIKAGKDLLAAAPGNPEHYQFFAQLCFQLGRTDEGLTALRRSVRVNPTNITALVTLASALADQFRSDEAIELYWRAFDKGNSLDEQLSVISKLGELYLRVNRFDQLVSRLQRLGRENSKQRDMTICLAAAYQSAGDLGSARSELERLLTEDTRDTKLLEQLSALAESEGDYPAAAKYQKRVNEIAPNKDGVTRLANLHLRSGEIDEAEAVWTRLLEDNREPARVLRAIDSLVMHGKQKTAQAILSKFLRDNPNDWEGVYREAMILSSDKSPQKASNRFNALLNLSLPDDTPSVLVRKRPNRSSSFRSTNPFAQQRNYPKLWTRITNVYNVRRAVGLDPNYNSYAYSGMSRRQWSPIDYGQARMAALGWLYARAQQENKLDAYVKSLQDKTGKSGTRAANNSQRRARWDWLYLNQVINENAGVYSAMRDLSYEDDIALKWTYVNSLNRRHATNQPSYGPTNRKQKIPPMPKDELAHVLQCFDQIKRQKPEWAAYLVNHVSTELQRADRKEEAQQLVAYAVANAKDLASIQSVMGMAVSRGDAKQAMTLLGRLTSLQSKTNNARYTRSMISNQAYMLAQLMGKRATEKALDDVLMILERYLDVARSTIDPSGRWRSSNPYARSGQINVWVWRGGRQNYVRMDYPTVNRYFDYGSLQLLRNAYEHYKKADLVSDLVSRFEAKAKKSDGLEATMNRLGLCYIHWWSDDKEASARQMLAAIKAMPNDVELRLELAQLKQMLGEPTEALAMVDSVEPLDHKVMQRRETFALNLAVITGNIKRARKAATRLFGLRLDNNTQLQLATQMHQLGMHKMAEGVLARVRRKSGRRQSMLVSLMNQYQQQGKTETAIQIAHQILRRSSGQTANPRSNSDYQRQQAVRVLARSGRINKLIERAEKQLEQSPKSVRLHQLLADYYNAAGKRKESHAVYVKLARLRPNDADLQYQVGSRLYRGGNRTGAVDFYLAAIRQEPRLFGRDYYQIQRAFRDAKRTDELAEWLENVDIRKVGRYYTVSNVARELLRNNETQERGMKLFKRAWEAFPSQRQYLLQSLYDQKLWELKETYDFARQVLVPQPAAAERAPWAGLDRVMSYSNNGRATGVLTRVLQIAEKQNKLPQLRGDIERTLQKAPKWSGGKAMLAILEAKSGKHKLAAKYLAELIADKDKPIPGQARWLIGQELEDYGQLEKQVLELYRGATTAESMRYTGMQFGYSASQRYVAMLRRLGRRQEARAFLLKAAEQKDGNQFGYDPDYMAYQRLRNIVSIGSELQKLGYAVDAIRLYSDANSDPGTLAATSRYGSDYYLSQIETAMKAAMKSLSGEKLADTLRKFTSGAPQSSQNAKNSNKKKPPGDRQAIDLVLLVSDKALDKARVTSLFAQAVLSTRPSSKVLAEAGANIDKLRADKTADLSILVADVLLAKAARRTEDYSKHVQKLLQHLTKQPLEKLPEGVRPNARQRAEAVPRLALWLVARTAWQEKPTKKLGDQLAEVAIEAARRQTDRRWIFAMLRERGEVALKLGDRAAAERYWSEMLKIVLTNPNARKKKAKSKSTIPPRAAAPKKPAKKPATKKTTAAKPEKAGSQASQAFPASSLVAISRGWKGLLTSQIGFGAISIDSTRGGISTIKRFEQAMQISRMAAQHKMQDLSLRAVAATLDNGPPIPLSAQSRRGGIGQISSIRQPSTGATTQINRQVEEKLFQLSAIWQQQGFPPKSVYQTLAKIVLPKSRAKEVFLYERPLTYGVNRPRSGGRLLVEWAIRAKTANPLRKELQLRSKNPRAALPAQVLLAQLDFVAGNNAQVVAALKRLGERVKKDQLRNTAELICHVAIPALHRRATADAALPIVAQATRNMSRTGSAEPLGNMLLSLARMQFKRKESKAAKENLEQYLDLYQRQNVRYSGDYGQYRRKQQLQTVIRELALGGEKEEALRWLGEYTDISLPRWERNLSLGSSLSSLARQLGSLTDADRYRTIKKWTFPAKARQSVRIVGSFAPRYRPPAEFAKTNGLPQQSFDLPGDSKLTGVVSSADLLIESAKSLGKLDELARELEPLAKKKVENADKLLLIVNIVRGKVTGADMRSYVAQVKKRVPRWNDYTQSIQWADYLVARQCILTRSLNSRGREILRQLIEHSKRIRNSTFRRHLRCDLALAVAFANRDPQGTSVKPGSLGGVWVPADYESSRDHANGSAEAMWVANSGTIASLAGSYNQYLYFAYPLTGTFNISADVYDGGWAEGGTAFAGLTYEPLGYTTQGYIFPAGRHERLSRAFSTYIKRAKFNRIQYQVTPKQVRFLLNGHPCYVDKNPSPTSPFFALYSEIGRKTFYRRIYFTGKPKIPSEVPLTTGNHMRGWITSFFSETQPKSLTAPKPAPGSTLASPSGLVYSVPGTTKATTDWRAEQGMLIGRKDVSGQTLDAQQSRIYYQRPLLNGESISYEFFYRAGENEVHPSVGRLAFLLKPEGVKLHWITDGASQEWTGLANDNSVSTTDFATKPPLKVNDWNAVQLTLAKDLLKIYVNGQNLGERKLTTGDSRLCGFFHFKDRTEAKVRNVKLTGNWPTDFTARDLTRVARSSERKLTRIQRVVRNQNIGDHIIGSQAFEVYQRSLRLQPERRYKTLKAWVLPSQRHWTHRLYSSLAPNRPARKIGDLQPGQIVSPALLLIDTAKELGKLDELSKAVNTRKYRALDRKREHTALQCLTAIAANDAEAAKRAIAEQERLLKGVNKWITSPRRWPFVLTMTEGLKYAPTRTIASRMIAYAVDHQLSVGAKYDPGLERYLRRLMAEVLTRQMPSFAARHYSKDWSLKHWQPVSHAQARTLADGYPAARWLSAKGELKFLGGGDIDLVYYKIPLQGDFQVTADLATFGWREQDVFVGGIYSSLRSDLKTVALGQYDRNLTSKILNPPFKFVSSWCKYQVVVQGGQYTASVNGRQIYSRKLPADPDPWIAIRTEGRFNGAVRNFRILGNPKVPTEIKLSNFPNLSNWLPNYYEETTSGENPHWQKRGEIIIGRRYATIRGSHHQSLLRYHRPLLEDGEISYEFFYQPGKTEVFPTMDRTAFIFARQGVRIHTLTDGKYDRSGLPVHNMRDVPRDRRKPLGLKADQWNQVTLKLQGDLVQLQANGQLVYEHKLRHETTRFFGLFHFADRTEARVRRVVYRGSWPRRVPPVEQQQMAASVTWDVPVRKQLKSQFVADFAAGEARDDATLQLLKNSTSKYVKEGQGGLIVDMPTGHGTTEEAHLVLRKKVKGDFDITLEFDQLKSTQEDGVFGPGVTLDFHVVGSKDIVTLERRMTKKSKHHVKVAHGVLDDKKGYKWFVPFYRDTGTGGRLRLIREGSTVYYLFAGEKAERYRLLNSRVIGTNDIERVRVSVGTRHAKPSIHVRLKKLSVFATNIE